jgi:hypothetical protein
MTVSLLKCDATNKQSLNPYLTEKLHLPRTTCQITPNNFVWQVVVSVGHYLEGSTFHRVHGPILRRVVVHDFRLPRFAWAARTVGHKAVRGMHNLVVVRAWHNWDSKSLTVDEVVGEVVFAMEFRNCVVLVGRLLLVPLYVACIVSRDSMPDREVIMTLVQTR